MQESPHLLRIIHLLDLFLPGLFLNTDLFLSLLLLSLPLQLCLTAHLLYVAFLCLTVSGLLLKFEAATFCFTLALFRQLALLLFFHATLHLPALFLLLPNLLLL